MRALKAMRALAVAVALTGVSGCQNGGDDGSDSSGSAGMTDPFTMSMVARLDGLEELTLWRVGEQAKGPGRDPGDPVARVALANGQGWAFSVSGDGRVDSTRLSVPPETAAEEAQNALVHLVEEATGREVSAVWSTTDADTWSAEATFSD
jgi:hypothetical protein